MKNKCYVISREQVTLDSNIEMADSVDEAREIQYKNRLHMVDSVYLTLDDLKQLSDMVDDDPIIWGGDETGDKQPPSVNNMGWNMPVGGKL